jgi:hypothetical protein
MSLVRLAILLGYSYVVTATVLSHVGDSRQPTEQPRVLRSPSVELALEVLGTSDRLYAAQVGYAGLNPPQVLAWRVLLINPRADSLFLDLLDRGTRPGQLYGLAGLRWLREFGRLDPKRYRAALQRLVSGPADEMVPTQIGCIGGAQPLRSLLAEVNSGVWGRELLSGRLGSGR